MTTPGPRPATRPAHRPAQGGTVPIGPAPVCAVLAGGLHLELPRSALDVWGRAWT